MLVTLVVSMESLSAYFLRFPGNAKRYVMPVSGQISGMRACKKATSCSNTGRQLMFAANVPDGQVKDSDSTKDMPSCFCATEEGLIGPKRLVGNSLPCAFNAQEIVPFVTSDVAMNLTFFTPV